MVNLSHRSNVQAFKLWQCRLCGSNHGKTLTEKLIKTYKASIIKRSLGVQRFYIKGMLL